MGKAIIIDTHAHMYDSEFESDLPEVMLRAVNAGIEVIVSVSEGLADAKRNLELSREYPAIKPAAGLYPAHLDINLAEEMIEFIRKEKDNLVAVSEVGLDYWLVTEEKDREIQREIFSRFIKLAMELDLPINVHSRSAGRQVVDLLLELDARKVQLHAFGGKASAALPAVEAGYYFSMPPSIVRSRQKQKLVKQLPLSCLLLETDSPVLGPDPEKRNEPENISISIDTLAELKGVSKEQIIRTALENTVKLYGDRIRT